MAGIPLSTSVRDLRELLPKLDALSGALQRLGEALLACWAGRGKALLVGNGGSAADAMHLAEELVVRFHDNRRALAAIALCDPTMLTCAGNDYGFESAFARQVEALGNAGDVLIVFSTSGNSANIVKAVREARERKMLVAGFLGKGGGALAGACDIELLVPSAVTHYIQTAHQVMYHALCEWIDEQVRPEAPH